MDILKTGAIFNVVAEEVQFENIDIAEVKRWKRKR
jgi:hypothetical protein